jgi:uncharacterized protein (TIGR03437 family)
MRLFLAALVFTLAAAAQEFPQAVDLVQRIDQLYPWLNVIGFDVDEQGDIYLAGSAKSPLPDILTTHFGPLGGSDIVVIKFDPVAQRMLYAVAIGGSGDDFVNQIKVDAAGNTYLMAITSSTDFPIVFRQGSRSSGPIVVKLNPAGTLTYSTSLTWATTIDGFNVDSAGTIYLSGSAVRGELPTTPSSYLPSPPDSLISGFVAKLNSLGQTLDAATYIFGAVSNLSPRANGDVVFSQEGVGGLDSSLSHLLFLAAPGIETFLIDSMTALLDIGQDNSGNIYVAGPNALRKYSPDGQQLLLSLDFPTATWSQFAVTHSGLVYLLGAVPANFPTRNASQPCLQDLPSSISAVPANRTAFMLVIGPDGETRYATYMAEQSLRISVSAGDGLIYALAQASLPQGSSQWLGIVGLNPDEIPGDHTSPACLAHAGTLRAGVIAPGTIMALFGYRLGPDTGTSSVAENGIIPFNVAGTTLTVDGKPAPILYTQSGQINFVAPWSLRTDGITVPVCASFGNDTSCLNVATYSFDPGFFILNNAIAAINQDGTINAQDHPASLGSYVSLYLTGTGMLAGTTEDGAIANLPLQSVTASVTAGVWSDSSCAFFGGIFCQAAPAQVLYAGAVPTLVNGASVVIIRIPKDFPIGNRWVLASFQLAGKGTDAGGALWIGP